MLFIGAQLQQIFQCICVVKSFWVVMCFVKVNSYEFMLCCPGTTEADVDRHNEAFDALVTELMA